jgi:hypothetical protein
MNASVGAGRRVRGRLAGTATGESQVVGELAAADGSDFSDSRVEAFLVCLFKL